MGVSGGPYIVRDSSLVLELDAADRNSYVSGSTTWRDLTGNNFTGSLTAGVTYNNTNGGNLVIPGSSNGIDCGNNFNLQSFTTTVWIKTTNTSGYNFLFSVGSYNSPIIEGWGLNILGTTLQFDHCNVANVTTYELPTIYNGQWVQLGIYRNSSNNVGIIVNGVIVTSTTYSTPFTNSNLWFGKRTGGTIYSPYFSGSMALASVYNRGLTTQEVLQNYNALKSRFNL